MTKRMDISDTKLMVTINDSEKRVVVEDRNEKSLELSDDEYLKILKYATKLQRVLDAIAKRHESQDTIK